MLTAEQIADEIIAARKPRGGARKRRKPHMALLSLPRGARAPAETPADGTALCAGSNAGVPFCWDPNCERCKPA